MTTKKFKLLKGKRKEERFVVVHNIGEFLEMQMLKRADCYNKEKGCWTNILQKSFEIEVKIKVI
jgi:hypothetical protein